VKAGEAEARSLWDSAVCVQACPDGDFPADYLTANEATLQPTDYVVYKTALFALACRPTEEALNDKSIDAAAKSIFGDVTKSEKGI